ncbi:MAG: hypothetical protein L6Q57_03015 [Alphaproteobacteria bacterium]|nr:hypothetical protein [Alphaproteobacteria bacterium]
MAMDINTVLDYQFVKSFTQSVCGPDTVCVERKNDQGTLTSVIVSKVDEAKNNNRTLRRVIILPPHGYTANAPDLTNAHDEVERATIEIKGGVRPGKRGFSKLKNCLLVASFNRAASGEDDVVSALDTPYRVFHENTPDLLRTLHSAGTAPFPVVEPDGTGFYHNMINLTDDWLVLGLAKQLRLSMKVEIEALIEDLPDKQKRKLRKLQRAVVKYGDKLFENKPKLVESVCDMRPEETMPALGEMLYTHDTGMHEACTVFAIILRIGKQHPDFVCNFLYISVCEQNIPLFYGEQLIEKIRRATATSKDSLPKPEQKMG